MTKRKAVFDAVQSDKAVGPVFFSDSCEAFGAFREIIEAVSLVRPGNDGLVAPPFDQ